MVPGMRGRLSPVGEPIVLRCESVATELWGATGYAWALVDSGTSALSLALSLAARRAGSAAPEVIVPAYGCPDLVSAAVFAGAKPVLVDLERERPWLNLDQLRAKVGKQTVAVIAASLFGISERISEIRPVAEQAGAVVIEDSAQAFPGADEHDFWQGDLVVLSFGRGKPVSLLGGGAVLCNDSGLAELLPATGDPNAATGVSRALLHTKARLYNTMISPRLYWIPQRLPFLHLGETRYHPLAEIGPIDSNRLAMLPANIAAYQQADLGIQGTLSVMLDEIAPGTSRLLDLPDVCGVSPLRRLLRYPVLLDGGVRDPLYLQLMAAGMGPSVMYPTALPGIPGLEDIVSAFNAVIDATVAAVAANPPTGLGCPAALADLHAAFEGRSGLVHTDRQGAKPNEIHPTNAGHKAIAQAFIDAMLP